MNQQHWTRFIKRKNKTDYGNNWDMIIIEASENIAVEMFRFMFRNSEDYLLIYSTPPTIEGVELYIVENPQGEKFNIRVFTIDDLKTLHPATHYKVY